MVEGAVRTGVSRYIVPVINADGAAQECAEEKKAGEQGGGE